MATFCLFLTFIHNDDSTSFQLRLVFVPNMSSDIAINFGSILASRYWADELWRLSTFIFLVLSEATFPFIGTIALVANVNFSHVYKIQAILGCCMGDKERSITGILGSHLCIYFLDQSGQAL